MQLHVNFSVQRLAQFSKDYTRASELEHALEHLVLKLFFSKWLSLSCRLLSVLLTAVISGLFESGGMLDEGSFGDNTSLSALIIMPKAEISNKAPI